MLGMLSGRPREGWKLADDDLPELPVLGKRLASVDQLFLEVFAQRLNLARLVEERKRRDGGRIYRKQAETDRLIQAREWATKLGVNPDFAHALEYFAISEACKVEMIQLQDEELHRPEFADEEAAYAWQKEQLLTLTARCARGYDAEYASTFFATRLYLEFEQRILAELVNTLQSRELALDLGCATGRQALTLATSFSRVVGYDISPEMVRVAAEKHAAGNGTNVRFEVADLEAGIPLADGCTDLAVMGMGVASDIRDLGAVLHELHRVLKHGGKAFLSFYNRNALVYQWNFIPWPLPLAAAVNLDRHCLDVRWGGKGQHEEGGEVHTTQEAHTFSIYARPYTLEEIDALMPAGMSITRQFTYPTLASVLPDVLFVDPAVCKSVVALDEHLADADNGAYALVTVRKT